MGNKDLFRCLLLLVALHILLYVLAINDITLSGWIVFPVFLYALVLSLVIQSRQWRWVAALFLAFPLFYILSQASDSISGVLSYDTKKEVVALLSCIPALVVGWHYRGKVIVQRRICPSCQKTLKANERFCSRCGTNVSLPDQPGVSQRPSGTSLPNTEVPLACPQCKRRVNPEDTFCGSCGTSLRADSEKTSLHNL